VNVELPDGTVVEGIPEGITKRELATKLKANGMTVPDEWLGPRKVGVVETAMRTVASTAQKAVQTFDMAAASLANVFGDTEGRDKIFSDMDTRQARMTEAYAPKADEEFSTAGELAGGVASIPVTFMSGPAGAGLDKSVGVVKRGGTLDEAKDAGYTTAGVETALQIAPLGAGLKVAKKMAAAGVSGMRAAAAGATGAAVLNTGLGVAARDAENQALPDRPEFDDMKTDPWDPKAMAMDAITSGAIGGVTAKVVHKGAKAKAQAKAANAFPAAKMKDLGDGDFLAPNGARITADDWENASPRMRDGWLKEAPKPEAPEAIPAGEAKEISVDEALAQAAKVDTAEVDRAIKERPDSPVAEAAAAVRDAKAKKAQADLEAAKKRADAAAMRQAALEYDDPDLKAELLRRADKLDPPNKIPAGEVKEGQPEIKVEQPKDLPVGKVIEGQPEIKAEDPGKIPAGEVVAEYPEGGTPVVRQPDPEPLPAGEAKELYADPNRDGGPLPVGEATEIKPLPVGQAIEGMPEIKADVPTKPLPVGQVVEGQPEIKVDTPAKPLPVGEAKEVTASGATPVERVDPLPTGEAKELYADPKRAKGADDVSLDMGLPKIDEVFMAEQERVRVRGPEQRAAAAPEQERGRRQVRAALEKGAADGTLDRDGVALATWALDKNPNLSRGMRLEASDTPPVAGAKGSYNNATRVVQLFKGKDNAQTAAHEILHHSERMMPQPVQDGIRREWRRQLQAEVKRSKDPVLRAALADIPRAMQGDAAARTRILKAFQAGVLDAKKHYALYDPSEFWAVNAARILSDRHAGRNSWRAAAKQWVREMIEHVKATVGVRSDSAVLKALNDILDPKKTTGVDQSPAMLKKVAVAADDVAMSLGPVARKQTLGDETRAEVAERKLFDRFNRVAKLQDTVPPKTEDADIYAADQRYAGRLQKRGEDLAQKFMKPLGKALQAAKKAGITVRDADDYLMALHAPERNAAIAQRNTKMQDGGSGLTNKQAQDIIDSFTPEQRKHLDAVAKIVHDLNRKKLDDMVDDGLISAQTRDNLNKQFKNYVPLKTLDAEDEFRGVGRGYEMRANDISTAMGRQSKAGSPIGASVMDASRALIRGEKARVDRTVWQFAQNSAAGSFIRIYDPENPPAEVMGRKIGPDGKVKEVVDPLKVQELTINLLVDGENRRVLVTDALLRDQLRKVATTADPGPVLAAVGRGTATIGRLLTEFNPSFTIPNAVKDAITVAVRAGAHQGVSTAKVMAGIPKAWKTIIEHKVGANTPGAIEYEEFLKHGGKTGAYGIRGVVDTMRDLEKAGAELGYKEHKAGYARRAARLVTALGRAISGANEVLEYASRFSMYQQVKAAGATPAKAVSAAKEITVNFNRSGEYGRAMNSVLVFANAALQGLRNTGVYMKNPKVRRNAMGIVMLGAASQWWNEYMGGENEETAEPNINSQNDSVADKNLVVLTPGERTGFKIPLPPEYAAFFAIGRRAYRAFSQGDVGKEAAGMAGAVIDATLPVRLPEADSTALAVGKSVVPTLVAPPVEVFLNQSYFGTPIVPEQRDDRAPRPYHTMSRATTSELAKSISEIANSVTGGDDIKPGLAQRALGPLVSPEGLEHMAKGYTGGMGQLVSQAGNIKKSVTEDKPLDMNKMPVASRFLFQEPQSYTSRRYKELAADYERAELYEKAGQSEKIQPRIQATLEQYMVAEKQLTQLFRELREAGASGADREPIQKQIKEVQSSLIKAYNQARNEQ
jgi:hypothetical protein